MAQAMGRSQGRALLPNLEGGMEVREGFGVERRVKRETPAG